MEYKMNNGRRGTIGHVGLGSAGLGIALAVLAASQSSIAKEKTVTKGVMKHIPRRSIVTKSKIEAFIDLPKQRKDTTSLSAMYAYTTGLKISLVSTIVRILEVYHNEDSVTEINVLGEWSNQHTAQYIHGAYAILNARMEDTLEVIGNDKRQVGFANTIRSIREQIITNMSAGLTKVLRAPEPTSNQTMSFEGIAAIKDFDNILRRINNVEAKMNSVDKPKKG